VTVTRPFSLLLVGVCIGIAYAGAVRATDTLPDRRAVRPVADTTGARGNDAVLDLLNEVEDLKAQVRRLRGQIEVQQHDLEQLKNGQRQSLIDFDRRLRELERRPAGASATTAPGQSVAISPPTLTGGGAASSAATSTLPAPRGVPSASEQQQYDAAFALMKQGLYQQAAARFREFVARNPSSPLADNAQYWVGEAAYVTRDFRTALAEFNKVVTNYPQSPKVPDALLKIGYTHYELAAYERARQVLNEVITRYPNTAVAKSAQLRLERIAKEGN
jgi:tol-pal system protein YbgF